MSRGHGVGSKLLLEMENRIASHSSISRIRAIATPGNYLTPGVDPFDMRFTCFLERHGYRWVGTTQNLIAESRCQRAYHDRLKALLQLGYTLRRADSSNSEKILQFVGTHFPAWQFEVQRSLLNEPPTVHICEAGDEVVGFSCSESNNVGSGVLGPTGVHPAHRRHGISQVTLHLCVDDLRNRGFERYLLGWTSSDLNYFFRREFGAERHGVYWKYEKTVS
jgi:N-acetylglutamate synthase-like GNAT family acetyltransferase